MIPPNTALLIIDVQRGLDHPKYGRRNNLGAEANIARLLAAWLGAGRPVVHVQHLSTSPDSPLRPDSSGVEIKPEMAPRDGEPLFQKRVNGAFIGTDLEQYLRRRGIASLVVGAPGGRPRFRDVCRGRRDGGVRDGELRLSPFLGRGDPRGRALFFTVKNTPLLVSIRFACTVACFELTCSLAEMEEELNRALELAQRAVDLSPEEVKASPLRSPQPELRSSFLRCLPQRVPPRFLLFPPPIR